MPYWYVLTVHQGDTGEVVFTDMTPDPNLSVRAYEDFIFNHAAAERGQWVLTLNVLDQDPNEARRQ